MFDLVQKNRRVVEVVLAVVVLGLVVGFGLQGYEAAQGGDNWLAKVGNATITEQQVDEVLRNQPDAKKASVLEGMVRNQVLLNEAHDLRLTPTQGQLQKAIGSIPAFQENGQFSPKLYTDLLGAQNIQPVRFEKRVSDQLATQQLLAAYAQSGYASNVTIERMARLMNEKREVVSASFKPEDYLAQATVTPAEVKQYYDAHQVDLKAPEMVRVEYVTLSAQALAQQLAVTDADVQKYFDAHKAELAKDERKAAHILIAVPKTASAAERQAAKAKAEGLLKQVRANPSSFAQVAKANSDDGSKEQGGDLGWFSADAMVKPFSDAAFKLKKGEISDLVESEYGYHIIQLEDTRTTALADVKPQVEQRLKAEKAQSQYQAQVDKFNELVYQQADSLKPAADQLKLQIQKSGWITRQGAQDQLLSNPRLTDALFSDDVLKKKHNTEAIEVQPGTMIAARVVEYKAAQVPPLATATPDIENKLRHDKAAKLAAADGAQKLTALQKGENVQLKWSEQPSQVGRMGERNVPAAELKAVFAVNPAKLPAYVGGADPVQGFVVYKVEKVIPAAPLNPLTRLQLAQGLEQAYGQAEVASYYHSLEKKAKIEVRNVDKAE